MGLLRREGDRRTGRVRHGLRDLWGAAVDPALWRRALILATLREGRTDPFAVEPDGGMIVASLTSAHRPVSRSEA